MPTPQPDGYRRSFHFEWPERVPWSELGPEFIEEWGHKDGKFAPEHMEITGATGSGKTYLAATMLQQRAQLYGSSEIFVVTKPDDDSVPRLGWPVVDTWKELQKYRQAIFWPRTDLTGEDREFYHEQKIYEELLVPLWEPNANTVLTWDEIGYVEELTKKGPGRKKRLKKFIRMIWREARSQGITQVAMKQRPIGVNRDQHSESRIKAVFPPQDRGDAPRFAEMLGAPADWMPVLDDLDEEAHECVLQFRRRAYITWVDVDLQPLPAQANQPDRTTREYLHGRSRVG